MMLLIIQKGYSPLGVIAKSRSYIWHFNISLWSEIMNNIQVRIGVHEVSLIQQLIKLRGYYTPNLN